MRWYEYTVINCTVGLLLSGDLFSSLAKGVGSTTEGRLLYLAQN